MPGTVISRNPITNWRLKVLSAWICYLSSSATSPLTGPASRKMTVVTLPGDSGRVSSVLLQCDNCGCSVPVGFRSKAQCAVNGWSFTSTVTQRRNPTGAPCGLTCQRPWTVLHLLVRTKAIICELRLAMNTDKPTVSAIITLKEH